MRIERFSSKIIPLCIDIYIMCVQYLRRHVYLKNSYSSFMESCVYAKTLQKLLEQNINDIDKKYKRY